MSNTAKVIENVISNISDEWYHKSSEEKRFAIMNSKWIEFEVAMSVRSPNYTLVPVDFYERIGKAIDENRGVKWTFQNIRRKLQERFLILSLKLCSILPWGYREKQAKLQIK